MNRIKMRAGLLAVLMLVLMLLGACSLEMTGQDKSPSGKDLEIIYLDVGQADSILITNGSSSMLIDAGNNQDTKQVVEYIKQQGIQKLDYVVGTHPHEDHIGGLDGVIKDFEVGTILMPKVSHTTKTYEDVLMAVKDKGMKITAPTSGTRYELGKASFEILAPNEDSYKDLNDYSIVIRLSFGDHHFLFQGDAETISEKEILKKGYDISADVIKLGHHGSRSSTSTAYLEKVNPKYAVITVGKDNDYGHPHSKTMKLLEKKGIPVYRTDESGTITLKSDGSEIQFDVEPGSYRAP